MQLSPVISGAGLYISPQQKRRDPLASVPAAGYRSHSHTTSAFPSSVSLSRPNFITPLHPLAPYFSLVRSHTNRLAGFYECTFNHVSRIFWSPGLLLFSSCVCVFLSSHGMCSVSFVASYLVLILFCKSPRPLLFRSLFPPLCVYEDKIQRIDNSSEHSLYADLMRRCFSFILQSALKSSVSSTYTSSSIYKQNNSQMHEHLRRYTHQYAHKHLILARSLCADQRDLRAGKRHPSLWYHRLILLRSVHQRAVDPRFPYLLARFCL